MSLKHINSSTTTFYTPLNSNPATQIQQDLKTTLDTAIQQNWITSKEYDFLFPKNPKVASFYLLPKVHKDLLNPPGRPIINGIDTITEPSSKYIDYFIKPLTCSLESYVQDTSDLLKKLERIHYVPSFWLATMDIQALYTNIDHCEGLEALQYYLQKRPNTDSPPTTFLVDLTRWTLHNNVFLFQDKLFKQLKGTAMGASYASNYAGLFLGQWEERYVWSQSNPFRQYIQFYGRYIDDLFFVFSGSEQLLKDFYTYLNNTNPNIKLSLDYSNKSINFLDLNVITDGRRLHTSIYRKPNTILRADSFHPHGLILNIPVGQFLRLRRICETDTDFN